MKASLAERAVCGLNKSAESVHYREIAPPDGLRRFVRCLWHLTVAADAEHLQTVYPDGCCELIAHRGVPMQAFSEENGWRAQPVAIFAAQQRSAVRLAARGDADCLGVRLQPAASAALFDVPLAELRDRIVDLAAIDPGFAARFLAAAAAPDIEGSAVRVFALIERRLASSFIDARIERAVAALEASAGVGPVAHVIATSGMSERAFQVAFRQQTGLSAKEFARILRLQATIRMLDGGGHSVADLAIERGFADQAHATREVRRVTGTTPAKLRDALRRDRDGDSSVRLAAAFVRGRIG